MHNFASVFYLQLYFSYTCYILQFDLYVILL